MQRVRPIDQLLQETTKDLKKHGRQKNVGKNSDSHNVTNFCRADQKHTLASTRCIKANLRHGYAHQVLLVQSLCSQTYRWNWTWIAASDGPGNSLMLPDQDILGRMMAMSAHSRGCDFLGKQIDKEEISLSQGRMRQGETSTADEPLLELGKKHHGWRDNGKSMFSSQFWWKRPTSFPIHSSIHASISRCSLHK